MIDGELYAVENPLRKWAVGASFLFNEPDVYSVYVKEGSPRTYTKKEAAELLWQGKKVKCKSNSCNFYYFVDQHGYVATSYGTRVYSDISNFLRYVHSLSEWVEYIEEEVPFEEYLEEEVPFEEYLEYM